MDAKDHRQASLSHWLHKHIATADHPWAGTFFFTDTQSDDAYKRAKRVADMMKPIHMPTLPAGAKHGVSLSSCTLACFVASASWSPNSNPHVRLCVPLFAAGCRCCVVCSCLTSTRLLLPPLVAMEPHRMRERSNRKETTRTNKIPSRHPEPTNSSLLMMISSELIAPSTKQPELKLLELSSSLAHITCTII